MAQVAEHRASEELAAAAEALEALEATGGGFREAEAAWAAEAAELRDAHVREAIAATAAGQQASKDLYCFKGFSKGNRFKFLKVFSEH